MAKFNKDELFNKYCTDVSGSISQEMRRSFPIEEAMEMMGAAAKRPSLRSIGLFSGTDAAAPRPTDTLSGPRRRF